MDTIAYIVFFLSIVNLLRMSFFLLGSDLYDILGKIKQKRNRYYTSRYSPLVSVIVPAHNEEKTLLRNLESIAESTYKNVEVIVVNDSSTDDTQNIALAFQRKYYGVRVLKTNVRGKGKALNYGLKYVKGSLVMCLDADSALERSAIENAVSSFRDRRLIALSANVKIFPGRGFLNLLQRIEYMVNHQMKKAEEVANIEYIIGGIGSMFRLEELKRVGFYDIDTLTEDIDLSMKLLEFYGTKRRIGYNPNVTVFTEAVLNLPDLYRQRMRWKYGRYQSFLKRRKLFFSTSHNYLLSWGYLPYALYAEISYLLEPLVLMYVLYWIVAFGDFSMLLTTIIVFIIFSTLQILGATNGYSLKERLKFWGLAMLLIIPIYLTVYYEYLVTVVGIIKLKNIVTELREGTASCEWKPVERAGDAILEA